jgi:hypothetical protein
MVNVVLDEFWICKIKRQFIIHLESLFMNKNVGKFAKNI